MQECKSLILLVGSNPLPNYLAAMALKPSKIHLVYSKDTKGPKERLRIALQEDLGSSTIADGDDYIDDPFDASSIGEKINEILDSEPDAHLHYTGGTKVMSAHALKTFYKHGRKGDKASYLDEAKLRLRFDNPPSNENTVLSAYGVKLKLDRILQLHDVKMKRSTIVATKCDAEAIAAAVLQRPQLASCLYGAIQSLPQKLNEAIEKPFCLADEHGISLSVPVIPIEGMSRKPFDSWRKFIGGGWLEEWTASKIEEIEFNDHPEITVGVNCTRAETGRTFEVDIAVIREQRSYFISCTTDMTRDRCKSKAFEILVRARHMGGDLARSALISLIPSNIVTDLRNDIADAWGSANATSVFGLEDIKTWAGHYGPPTLESLKDWLES